jgi:hypothetical protein
MAILNCNNQTYEDDLNIWDYVGKSNAKDVCVLIIPYFNKSTIIIIIIIIISFIIIKIRIITLQLTTEKTQTFLLMG